MKEDFLHYVWKHQKVSAPLIKEQGYLISVFKPGSHNKHGGPDFEFAELILNDLRWVGAVEIHFALRIGIDMATIMIQPMML